jgi:hypothetical protein
LLCPSKPLVLAFWFPPGSPQSLECHGQAQVICHQCHLQCHLKSVFKFLVWQSIGCHPQCHLAPQVPCKIYQKLPSSIAVLAFALALAGVLYFVLSKSCAKSLCLKNLKLDDL